MIRSSTAVLAVADVTRSVAFYVEVLGFQKRWLWGNPPTFGCIGFEKAELFVCEQPALAGRVEGHMHFFSVDGDVDALYAQHRAAGATIVDEIAEKPWGVREYAVRDPSGYHLRFGGDAKFERKPTALEALPAHVRIDVGVPDLETCKSLFASVGWTYNEQPTRDSLANTLVGVTAIDARDGRTIGMARATGDGKFYMLWDVVVRPSHQGQHVGRTMVERVLDELRRGGAPPGAFVGLFTGKPGFYEHVGFQKDIGMHRVL